MKVYELWDLSTGNMIACDNTFEQALESVRAYLDTGDPTYEEDLGLALADEDGVRTNLGQGRELAARAREKTSKITELDFSTLADAPVDAMPGVSSGDAELLRQHFGIRTIRDLARNKYVLWAQAIDGLSGVPKEPTGASEIPSRASFDWRHALLALERVPAKRDVPAG